MTAPPRIAVRFFRLSEPLAPYFTALYLTEIDAGEGLVTDYLHPEWPALRFTEGPPPVACVGPGALAPQWPFVANGPTSRSIHFGVRTSRVMRTRRDERGKTIDLELVALSERRILSAEELGRTCISCGESECHDRPDEQVLVSLRRRPAGSR